MDGTQLVKGVLDLAVGKFVYDHVAHRGERHVIEEFFAERRA